MHATPPPHRDRFPPLLHLEPATASRPVLRPVVYAMLGAILWGWCMPLVSVGDEPPSVNFNRDVLPILSDKCFACHGPDANKREADLRLDLREAAIEHGALLPGSPEKSSLIDRVLAEDPEYRMPPASFKVEPLTETETVILRKWIQEGAVYQKHWSFESVQPQPEFERDPSAGIDQHIRQALQQQSLTPQPPADRSILIRRLSFDLIGLPASEAEIADFLADGTPEAYEKVVDRLLASPHYGEKMAVDWLDTARYADSFGFQVDREWEMWPWRDWVISAYNRNLPFDQFLTWQLAGDLLPNATQEQRLATAFNRLHQQESEGGSVEEEYRVEYVCDRVQTFSTTFLGLTMECSRCHDHKYDPIKQSEFYQLFAMFQNIDEAGLYSYFTGSPPTPTVWLTDEATERSLQEKQKLVMEQEQKLNALMQRDRGPMREWWQKLQSSEAAVKEPTDQEPADQETIKSEPNTAPLKTQSELAYFPLDQFENQQSKNQRNETQVASVRGENQIVSGVRGQGIQFTGDDAVDLPIGNFGRDQAFSLSFWVKTPNHPERAVLLHRSRAWTDAASRGYEVLLEEGKLKWSLIHFWPGNAISIRDVQNIPVDTWVHVVASYDGSSRAAGLRLWVDGKRSECQVVRDHLKKEITGGGGDTIALGERFRDRGFRGGCIDEVRIYDRVLTGMEVASLKADVEVAQETSPLAEKERLRAYFEQADEDQRWEYYLATQDAEWNAGLQALREARKSLNQTQDGVKEMMAMSEMQEAKPAPILIRGEYSQPGELVTANVPAILGALPAGAPKNRLGLAMWLTDPAHPLAARVTVNRIWQSLFGRGLVKTSEDFGSQGARPRYPEVLDGLAWTLQQQGWDVKRLIKSIVMSETYRQSSRAEGQQWQDDPDNEHLARGPRFRLPAEMIRDNALTIAGLLNRQVGGPSVNPYEMTEAFKPVAASTGPAAYRRSLYTTWRRTSPPPAMLAFDAPRRAVCIAKRERTDSPLQALILLNGTQYVEAARVLGEQLYLQEQGDLSQMIKVACLRCLGRLPDEKELAILRELYQEQFVKFEAKPEAAKQLLAVGATPRNEAVPSAAAAATTIVMQTLLNHDGCVVKR